MGIPHKTVSENANYMSTRGKPKKASTWDHGFKLQFALSQHIHELLGLYPQPKQCHQCNPVWSPDALRLLGLLSWIPLFFLIQEHKVDSLWDAYTSIINDQALILSINSRYDNLQFSTSLNDCLQNVTEKNHNCKKRNDSKFHHPNFSFYPNLSVLHGQTDNLIIPEP